MAIICLLWMIKCRLCVSAGRLQSPNGTRNTENQEGTNRNAFGLTPGAYASVSPFTALASPRTGFVLLSFKWTWLRRSA